MKKQRLQAFIQRFWQIFCTIGKVFLDEGCILCHRPLSETGLCLNCWTRLPYTHYKGTPRNPLERTFWAYPTVERANAFLIYKPGYEMTKIIKAFKYKHRPDYARIMGEAMAQDLVKTDFFNDIDYIIPLPISKERLLWRGYNQSECLAQGVQKVTHIPILTTAVIRSIHNPSQIRVGRIGREVNVKDIFSVIDETLLRHRRVLLIDDVITLGATMKSLIQTIEHIEGLRIRILCLSAAGRYRPGRLEEEDLRVPNLIAEYNPSTIRRYHSR